VLAAERLDGSTSVDRATAERLDRIRAAFADEPRYREIAPADYGREQVTGLSYRVGMVMFAVLYRMVGHDRFTRIVGEYYRTYADSGGSTADFVALANRVAGDDTNLEPFFDDWIFSAGWYGAVGSGASLDDLVERYRNR